MNYNIQFDYKKSDVPTITGTIQDHVIKNWKVLCDGWTVNHLKGYDPEAQKELTGVYNIISWSEETGKIIIENDILGQRPLFASFSEDRVVISDNFWSVVSSLSGYEIDYTIISQLQHFRRIAPSWKTVVKGVYRLPAGGRIEYSKGQKKPTVEQVHWMKQAPDETIQAHDAAEQLHDAFLKLFEMIGDVYPGRDVWFGNSGGLDSRLIPAYARKAGLDVSGFLVIGKKPFIKTQSEISAEAVAKEYGFRFRKFEYNQGDGWERLLRDLYVNPFGPANFHKNPRFEDFKDQLILNGGDSFTIVNDNNFWRTQNAQSDPVDAMVNSHLFRTESWSEEYGDYVSIVKSQLKTCLDSNSSFSVLRSIHQSFLNQTSPAGAFESMNLAGEFQYIYHPFATKYALKWPEWLFYDRKVQTVLFERYFPNLLKIPDQRGFVWKNGLQKNAKNSLLRKIEYRLRTSGLQYRRWMNSAWMKEVLKNVSVFIDECDSQYGKEFIHSFHSFSNTQDQLDMMKLSVLMSVLESNKLPVVNSSNQNS